jgi:hypothetical protein
MLNFGGYDYKSWQDYFKSIFAMTEEYERIEEGIRGQTIIEKYVPLDKNNKTEIRVGYLDETLIYWKFQNPLAEGFNGPQELEYFYRYDFTPNQSYGDPGLEFIDINLRAIDKQLRHGLRGKEIQYYKDGKLIRSKILIEYNNNQEPYPLIIHFEKRDIWKKVVDLFAWNEKDQSFVIKEIDLKDIFGGLQLISKLPKA